jgi:hypothetical protein
MRVVVVVAAAAAAAAAAAVVVVVGLPFCPVSVQPVVATRPSRAAATDANAKFKAMAAAAADEVEDFVQVNQCD